MRERRVLTDWHGYGNAQAHAQGWTAGNRNSIQFVSAAPWLCASNRDAGPAGKQQKTPRQGDSMPPASGYREEDSSASSLRNTRRLSPGGTGFSA